MNKSEDQSTDKNYAALILSRSALRRWTDLYAKLQNECGEVVSRKIDYNLPPADHVPALEAIDAALSATTPPTNPLGWVTITDNRVSDPVYRTREDAEKDADLLRARGIETKVAGVYLAPQSAVAPLTVTRGDGVPLPDQAAALQEFKTQARLGHLFNLLQAIVASDSKQSRSANADMLAADIAQLARAPQSASAPIIEATVGDWQCRDYADGWITFPTRKAAETYQRDTGALMRYVRLYRATTDRTTTEKS